MNDLVKRLRAKIVFDVRQPALCEEAATEIEHLEGLLSQCWDACTDSLLHPNIRIGRIANILREKPAP
jgi:hypothetical protein